MRNDPVYDTELLKHAWQQIERELAESVQDCEPVDVSVGLEIECAEAETL